MYNLSLNSVAYFQRNGGGDPTPAPPVNEQLPTIVGTPQVDSALVGSDGTWTNDPTSFAYQWQLSANGTSGWADISGASGPTYTPILSEVGQYLRIGVTASNDGGSSAQAYSAASGPVEDVTPPD